MSSKKRAKPSKHNVKRRTIVERKDGLDQVVLSQNKRFPIISLPDILVIQRHRLRLRYINNGGAVNGNMTTVDCANFLMMAATTTSLVSLIKASRIRKIQALSPVTTQGTSVTLTFQPDGVDTSRNSFNCLPEAFLDTSASIDVPAYLCLKPSISTPLGSWHLSDSGAASVSLLTITAPAGTTLDIEWEFTLNEFGANTSTTATVAGASVGSIYHRPILTNFIPQYVNQL